MTEINLSRRIVCAANKYKDSLILGPRHWDSTMREQYDYRVGSVEHSKYEQGFINTWGEFLSREDAWIVACANGQVMQYVGSQSSDDFGIYGTKLYSENLY